MLLNSRQQQQKEEEEEKEIRQVKTWLCNRSSSELGISFFVGRENKNKTLSCLKDPKKTCLKARKREDISSLSFFEARAFSFFFLSSFFCSHPLQEKRLNKFPLEQATLLFPLFSLGRLRPQQTNEIKRERKKQEDRG